MFIAYIFLSPICTSFLAASFTLCPMFHTHSSFDSNIFCASISSANPSLPSVSPNFLSNTTHLGSGCHCLRLPQLTTLPEDHPRRFMCFYLSVTSSQRHSDHLHCLIHRRELYFGIEAASKSLKFVLCFKDTFSSGRN